MNHLYIRVELRAKHAAARSKKGVVGKSGTNMPMIPKTRARMPTMVRSDDIILFMNPH